MHHGIHLLGDILIVSPACISELKYHGLHKIFQHNRVRISITGNDTSSCHFAKTCFQLKVSLASVFSFHWRWSHKWSAWDHQGKDSNNDATVSPLPCLPAAGWSGMFSWSKQQSKVKHSNTLVFETWLSVQLAISVYNASIATICPFILWLRKSIMKLRVPQNISLCGICYGVASLVLISALEFILLFSVVCKQSLPSDGKSF